MIEKFSDYETGYLATEGVFEFEVKSYELAEGIKAAQAVFDVKCDEGITKVRHSLAPNARWSYNKFISACLNLTPEKKRTLEIDYEVIGNDLVGKKFIGVVSLEVYDKISKEPQDDGTFKETTEKKEAYKITEYKTL